MWLLKIIYKYTFFSLYFTVCGNCRVGGDVGFQTLLSSSLCQMNRSDGENHQLLVSRIGPGEEDYSLEKAPRSSCGLWTLPTRNFYLCTIVQLFKTWNWKHPDILHDLADLLFICHMWQSLVEGNFSPTVSYLHMSFLQCSHDPLQSSHFSAPSLPWKALRIVSCCHWDIFTSCSVSPSLSHMQREGKGVCLFGQG